MQPNTVSTRLQLVYAFLRYLVDREVVHPDLLKRKLKVKVPEALPRAMDPEDVQQLLAVIEKPWQSSKRENPMAITAAILSYRRFLKRRNYSGHTIKNYMHTLKQFVLWVDVPIEAVNHKKLLAYLDHLLNRTKCSQ